MFDKFISTQQEKIRTTDREPTLLHAQKLLLDQCTRWASHTSLNQMSLQPDRLVRWEIQIEAVEPLAWLVQQQTPVKTYWCDRDQEFEMAGAGEAIVIAGEGPVDHGALFRRIRESLDEHDSHLRYYGGLRFSTGGTCDPGWRAFQSYRFIVPVWELLQQRDRCTLALNLRVADLASDPLLLERLLHELQRINFSNIYDFADLPACLDRHDSPDRDAWQRIIDTALRLFEEGDLAKIVLARKTILELAHALDPVTLLQHLKLISPNQFFFCFQIDTAQAFLGGSPERLYRREKHMLKSEAIAGTMPRSPDPIVDQVLAEHLLLSEKDVREHRYVLQKVASNFEKLCETVDIDDEVTVLKLQTVQHLRCRLQGIIGNGLSDAEILRVMHPTPAVGGSPTEMALRYISELEPFDRGWYAAPVGWIARDSAEFVVGIRSGRVDKNRLELYAGAGIVQGSVAAREWAELENKIANFLHAVGAK